MEGPNSKGKELKKKYGYQAENVWLAVGRDEEVQGFCQPYKEFLSQSKTERESVEWAEAEAQKSGFVPLEDKQKLRPGDRVYTINRDKNIILVVAGSDPIENGLNMVGSHVDAPRIDLKPNPLYEDTELALLKTHYYGGIKKYQWTTLPLAIHGVIFRSDGEKVTWRVGDRSGDPQFCITDLLPHLARDQMQKKMSEGITGEALNVLLGSIPYAGEKLEERVKLHILELLGTTYGITEEDFERAELEIVPAFPANDVGLDRSMVGSYGQDDRICAYASMRAIMELGTPGRTALCILADKEEIGSEGNTGMQSAFLENEVARVCAMTSDHYSEFVLRDALFHSQFLSADVTAAVDPTYEDVDDKRNAVYLGKGVAVMKYSGSAGKGGASDANAEFIAKITNLFNQNHVVWQTGEMGKVDKGGGGTIAKYLAKTGMDVLDVGPAILCMHSPFEIASKADVYMAYRAYKAFYGA